MNEVSLTGCFLNDLQSPEKGVAKNSALIHVLNENSRDSLFFNVNISFLFLIFKTFILIFYFKKVDTIGGLMDP